MDGWMELKYKGSWGEGWGGLEQELDACLITVIFFGCGLLSGKNDILYIRLCFKCLSRCNGEKEGVLQKPCRHEDSPVLFCHFFLYFLLELPLWLPSSPPVLPLWSHFKALGTTQRFISFMLFHQASNCDGGEQLNIWDDVWMKTSIVAVSQILLLQNDDPLLNPASSHSLYKDFHLLPFILQLWKLTVRVRQGQRWIEKRINNRWTEAVMKCRVMSFSH